jgi:integrase/recombinase XerC
MSETVDAPWIEDYLSWFAAQRRAAPLTVESYRRDLHRLAALAAGRPPQALSTTDIRRFVAKLHGEGLAGHSIARLLSAWRGLYRWLILQQGFAHNPVEGIRAPRSPSVLPRVLSPEQAASLLDAPAEAVLEVRDCAMFELFYTSGLRLAELAGLDVAGEHAGLDFDAGMVTVLGKRARRRTVPVGDLALAAIQEWLAVRGQIAGAELALFVTRNGKRMSPGAIRSRLALRSQTVGLGVHVHPHMFRHSFASHLLQSSGDLRAVQELLGHASIRSTQVYTHLDFQHLAQVYDLTHPRAKK